MNPQHMNTQQQQQQRMQQQRMQSGQFQHPGNGPMNGSNAPPYQQR